MIPKKLLLNITNLKTDKIKIKIDNSKLTLKNINLYEKLYKNIKIITQNNTKTNTIFSKKNKN